jgi:hypothetical protein
MLNPVTLGEEDLNILDDFLMTVDTNNLNNQATPVSLTIIMTDQSNQKQQKIFTEWLSQIGRAHV